MRIQGSTSGTLGFLLTEVGSGRPFSAALRAAMAKGYTEPDPREDLSGQDVARKALILGRLLGFRGELQDVEIEPLVPSDYVRLPLPEFLERLGELDAWWAERAATARAQSRVLRYLATVTKRKVSVSLAAVEASDSFAGLSGTDNQIAFTTRRYGTERRAQARRLVTLERPTDGDGLGDGDGTARPQSTAARVARRRARGVSGGVANAHRDDA